MKTINKLKIIVHVAAWLPVLWLIVDYLNGSLTANPIQAATQRTGRFALIFLLLTLACTPLSVMFRYRGISGLRRTLGLYSFFFAALHLLIYVGLDYGFAWRLIWQSLSEKRFIIAGMSAFVILLLLALTSFRWWMRALGKNWKRLHRLVYPAALLVVLHYAWAKKGDIFRLQGDVLLPGLAALIVLLLFAARLPVLRRWIEGGWERLAKQSARASSMDKTQT